MPINEAITNLDRWWGCRPTARIDRDVTTKSQLPIHTPIHPVNFLYPIRKDFAVRFETTKHQTKLRDKPITENFADFCLWVYLLVDELWESMRGE